MSHKEKSKQSAPALSGRQHSSWSEKFMVEERLVPASTQRGIYLTSLALAAVGLGLFLVLLVGVLSQSGLQRFDQPVATWFISQRSDTLTDMAIVLAVAFGPVALPIIVLLVILGWTLLAKHAWRPVLLAAGMATGLLLAQTIPRLVQHPRPPVDLMLFGADSTFSFPSGHVLGTSNFLLILAFLIASRRQQTSLTVLLFTIAAVVILAQVASRLYLGYHWLSDTAASIALSLLILGVLMSIDTARTVRVPGEQIHGAHSQPQVDGT
ncbi:phosphatase PAP2 family protein [Arthrobacter glacialis]|uniref:Phosphoesterase n=1 Tax=Arthrobacter glacialis TaxID=1664 RepID=A0A2S3ZTY7_ARTGL|nr:phosphatase PAP2 family protein [Arthrobacter glacialis]POH57843.1 phosphoesterase [Arthrobacter glacialis]POH72643.1 phosphoesterase [Arthrobacter glacialis]